PRAGYDPCGKRAKRRDVGVEAAEPRLAVRLLRARVARESPADEDPGDSVHEQLRAGGGDGGHHVGPHSTGVADAEYAGQDVVEDLARAEQRGRDADGDCDESLERAQGGVAVLA